MSNTNELAKGKAVNNANNDQDNKKGFISNNLNRIGGEFLDRAFKAVSTYAFESVKTKLGEEFYFTEHNMYDMALAQMWLYKKGKDKYDKYSKKIYIKNDEKSCRSLEKCKYIIKLDKATYCRVLLDDGKNNNDTFSVKQLFIYIFGRSSKKYVHELIKAIRVPREARDFIFTGIVDKNDNSPCWCRVPRRKFDTIFIDPKKKKDLISFLHKWKKNKQLFISKGLNYKAGILLYGEAGTGKSSIAKAIATEIDCDMIVINVNNINSINTAQVFKNAADDRVNANLVVLLEDIDCVTGKREDNKKLGSDEKKALNKMLQLLDGVNSISNTIFVATTNCIDKLDPALIRPGRFNMRLEIGKIDRKTAIEMCNSFNISSEKILGPDEVLINPSDLQDRILIECMND
jgi:hypothetical protein